MKLNINEENILIINVYMPTTGQDKDYKTVLESLNDMIKMEEDDSIVIITGDLNTRPDKKTPRNKWLEDFLKEQNLTKPTPPENTHRSHRWVFDCYKFLAVFCSFLKFLLSSLNFFPDSVRICFTYSY